MFTGIIETLGWVEAIEMDQQNMHCWVNSPISQELKIDQSVAHNGVCLTVDSLGEGKHRVTAVAETLQKTQLGDWHIGSTINLERCLPMGGRLDGHIVQGHVDTTGTCELILETGGSWLYQFSFPESFAALVIEKGSIAVNGISLTCFNITRQSFQVAIIPYTYEHTNLSQVQVGHRVNLEFDLLGKYVQRQMALAEATK